MTESALIQSFKGPNGGITTTPVISRINWLIITLLYFLAYEEKKRECYQTMSAITVRVAELTAAPIWATSYLHKIGLKVLSGTFFRIELSLLKTGVIWWGIPCMSFAFCQDG